MKTEGETLSVTNQKYLSKERTGYFNEKGLVIDHRTNAIAYRVLAKREIDLKDADLEFTGIDMSSMQNYGLDPSFIKTDLGEIRTYQEHQVLLEDVDPHNIPYDREIILFPRKTRVHALGRLMPGEYFHSRGRIASEIFTESSKPSKLRMQHCLWFLPVFYFFLIYLQVLQEYHSVSSFYRALDRENKELLDTLKNLPIDIPRQTRRLTRYFNA